MSRACTAAAIVFAAAFMASAAQAFTVQDSNGPVGGQGYLDFDKPTASPDRMAPVNRFGNENGQTTIKQGSGTFQFGAQQSFGQRYNTDNIFNPYTREGR
jgi:opacity protein-like surface antigen